MGGKREPSDSHSMASASSQRSDPAAASRKPSRFFSLRRVIQDIQQQRILSSSSSSRKRRSTPPDDPRSTTSTDPGWPVVGGPATGCVDEQSEGSGADSLDDIDCPLCALKQESNKFIRVTASCPHRICRDCLLRYLTIEIMESRVNVECPACPEKLHPNDVQRILGKNSLDLIAKYEEFTLRRLLVHDPDARWCPAPDCGYVALLIFIMTLCR